MKYSHFEKFIFIGNNFHSHCGFLEKVWTIYHRFYDLFLPNNFLHFFCFEETKRSFKIVENFHPPMPRIKHVMNKMENIFICSRKIKITCLEDIINLSSHNTLNIITIQIILIFLLFWRSNFVSLIIFNLIVEV